ncbi:MAG: hypothetical protein K0U98_08305 [Deltaproteobacteria bacterium]|nr:hypothetical protein [Deltaproteobacteria bacterium]
MSTFFRLRHGSILASALFLSAISLPAVAISLQSASPGGLSVGAEAANEVQITQSDVEALESGEMLEVTLDGDTVLTLDYSEGFVDLNRISVGVPDGRVMNLFQTSKQEPRWNVFQRSGHFSISDDPSNFPELTEEEVDLLRQFGELNTNEVSAMRMNAGCWCIVVLLDNF